MNVLDQVNLCTLLMKRLDEAVKQRENDLLCGRKWNMNYVEGVGRYQIKADITRLRRELQKLSEAVM